MTRKESDARTHRRTHARSEDFLRFGPSSGCERSFLFFTVTTRRCVEFISQRRCARTTAVIGRTGVYPENRSWIPVDYDKRYVEKNRNPKTGCGWSVGRVALSFFFFSRQEHRYSETRAILRSRAIFLICAGGRCRTTTPGYKFLGTHTGGVTPNERHRAATAAEP